MTVANISYPLTKRYARVSGQILNLQQRIKEAERLYGTLPELRGEIAEHQDQLVHIAGLMRGIDPSWDHRKIEAVKPHTYSLPYKYGDSTRMAYDILRESGRWMTIKEVVLEILRREELEFDTRLYVATANNVGAGFRRRLARREIERDVNWTPHRWRLVAKKALSKA